MNQVNTSNFPTVENIFAVPTAVDLLFRSCRETIANEIEQELLKRIMFDMHHSIISTLYHG